MTEHRLGGLDYGALAVYFVVLVGMGVYFSRRERDIETFFLGKRRVPWWAVGISIFGTSLSAITYISIPATAFAGDWTQMIFNLGTVLLAPFVVMVYMPRLRGTSVSTAYEYLEERFNLATRLYGSLVFFVFQLGRMAIVLYLPAMVLASATGIDVVFCILTMGLLATLYTVLGGIEAVIWTDVIQSIVLVFGAILALGLVVFNIDGGVGELFRSASEAGKFHAFTWTWDMTAAAAWVAIVGGIFSNAYPMMADQTVVQRYLSTADAREASKAVWTNALLTIPIQLLFFGLGTALWVFFQEYPELLNTELPNDSVLPQFVMAKFPAGLRGVLIAGLFAASMSSLDSSMNSLASVTVNDYYRRFRLGVTERQSLRAARVLTVIFGLFGTISALYVATYDDNVTMFTLFLQLLGLVGGGLAGLFVLGVATRRANGVGALTGAVVSGVVMYYVRSETELYFFGHAMIGFVTAFVVGYGVSWVVPERVRSV